MSNVDELPDLAGEVSARAVPPPYDEVTHRVRARRGRTAVTTLAATAVVLGGLGIWQYAADPVAGPRPPAASSGPSPTTDGSWRDVVNGTDSHPFEISGGEDGSIAVVWRALEPGSPTFALVIRDADGSLHGRRLLEPVSLTPVPGGWVGTYRSRSWLITTDDGWTSLPAPSAARDARPGDVVVNGQYSSWLYSPDTRSLASLEGLDGDTAAAYVTADGQLMRCFVDETAVHVTDGGAPVLPGRSCAVVGRGDDVAVVTVGDDRSGDIPMLGLATRIDGEWRRVERPDLLDGVSSLAVTADGSTAVAGSTDGRWFLVRPDGDVTSPARRAASVFVAGDRLYVTTHDFMTGPLAWTDDDGRTWHETVLPGLD